MYDIFAMVGAMGLGAMAILVFAIAVKVWRSGSAELSGLASQGYGIKAWAKGSLGKVDGSPTIHYLEGVEMRAHGGKLETIRRTRAPTSENW